MIIVFPFEQGIAVIKPTGEIPIEEVARKDVPAGVPFLFVDAANLPGDWTFRAAWQADFSAPHGYGIGAKAWFIEQYHARRAEIEASVPPEPMTLFPLPTEESVADVPGRSDSHHGGTPVIRINLEKARAITHDKRRAAREREFAPHDAVIAKQIPGKSASEAEASRAVIRAKYDAMQAEISGAADPEALKAIIEREGL